MKVRHLPQVILNILSINSVIEDDYGPGSNSYLQYKCRLDWRYSNINSAKWLNYKFCRNEMPKETVIYSTPIEDEYYIYIGFTKLFFDLNVDSNVYFNDLIEKIMSTVKVELSPDAQR